MKDVTWTLSDLKDDQGRYRTRSLFFEFDHETDRFAPIFTLKPRDHGGCVSLKRLYLELALPDNEYEFATTVFGEWEHWKKLCEPNWFKPYLNAWREELEIKVRSQVIKSMYDTARFEGSKGTAAARWIAEAKWKSSRGRPSKEEVERAKKIEAGIQDEIDDHYSAYEEYVERAKH